MKWSTLITIIAILAWLGTLWDEVRIADLEKRLSKIERAEK